MALLILIPALFALAQLRTKKYIFSPLTTLACVLLALPGAPVISAALLVSCIGDYFMSHKGSKEWMYLLGIAGFFLGHVAFIAHSLMHVLFSAHELFFLGEAPRTLFIREALFTGAVLAIWFTPYLILRVIRKVPKLLKIPVLLYTFISIAGLACAVMTGNPFYILGIALLLFSDAMIAEYDFVGTQRVRKLIMPTYLLCHIFVALSALV